MSHSTPQTWEYDLCGPRIPAEPARTMYRHGQAAMRHANRLQDGGDHANAAAEFASAAQDAARLRDLAERYGDSHRAGAWRTVAELRKLWHDRARANAVSA